MATTQKKARRKLSDISFEHQGAHVALTSKDQGGPANQEPYALVLKSNFSKEFVQKMQQVQVTLELPEFLRKFFNVYYEDAEVLARMMGYVEPEDESGDTDSYEDYYEKRIQDRLASYTVLKSMEKAEDIPAVLATLNEEQYLALLQDQEAIEKATKNFEAAKATSEEGATEAVANAKESVTKAEDAPSGESKKVSEKSMQKKEDQKPATPAVEMVEKSVVTSLEKALEDQKELLTKALAEVEAFKAEKKEAIVKAKTAKIEALVKDKNHSAVLVKAAVALESDEDFEAFVASVQALVTSVEKSELFVEKGATVALEEKKEVESAVAKAVKAQLSKAK